MSYEMGISKDALIERYGEKVGEWLFPHVEELIATTQVDYPTYDHTRVCEVGIEEEEKEYDRIKSDWCCEPFDGEETYEEPGKPPRTFKFGFHFGHGHGV